MTHFKVARRPYNGGLNNLIDEFFGEMPGFLKNNNNSAANSWGLVPVNIAETENAYVLEVVAPGFDKADFKVDLEENLLTIAAGRKQDEQREAENWVRREFQYRSFQRSFTLDEKIDAAAIEAKYVNGVLTLNLPKKVEVKTTSKKIDIQ